MSTQFYQPVNAVKVVTAAALFDGHDAAINIIRRVLQDAGAEVVHIGHNRSAREIVDAAIQEDAAGIAVSSYQGGHVEFFKYIVDLLKEEGASHIRVFGGGGGVIIPREIKQLCDYGVARIFTPEDGSRIGFAGIINDMMREMDDAVQTAAIPDPGQLDVHHKQILARSITALENAGGVKDDASIKNLAALRKQAQAVPVPVIGLTGTGGAGKSSLTDELIMRLLRDFETFHLTVISCDPSRRKTGGALLGDRIRMNSLDSHRVYMRSLATRGSQTELPETLPDIINVVKAAGYDMILVETAGIGQGDSRIVDHTDISVYVMTADYGAPSQLEKIDMLDYADLVVLNKFEKKGSEDALRDIRKQVQRNRKAFGQSPDSMPVYATIASRFNDNGVNAFYHGLLNFLNEKTGSPLLPGTAGPKTPISLSTAPLAGTVIIPDDRIRYLSDIADTVRTYHDTSHEQARALRRRWHLVCTLEEMRLGPAKDANGQPLSSLKTLLDDARAGVHDASDALLESFKTLKQALKQDELVYVTRDRKVSSPLNTRSLSHLKIPKIAVPDWEDPGQIYQWMRKENFAGHFPFTAGVFPLRRSDEDPTRMFAGEGTPADTNRRFKLLSMESTAKRLSTAFDSVTLYGFDPDIRPDIYGKIGTSGVSVCTIDDVKLLYDGFDLCAPGNSVSMTINGPAPIMLAMFLNTAIDQQVEAFERDNGRPPGDTEAEDIRQRALSSVRGTVQADILKEDQGQNTCIFSIEFALKMMGDIQQYFIDHDIRNFYSVSISGYHIAEAGANPVTQLALTLANGFSYVEYYLSRGMAIDDFAPSLSFFFSNGMDPEYTVIGRVARRIWALAMKYRYKAGEKSQKLKYHVQTSGRSLHARDIQLNDIRTTLQGLCAVYDNCNSLHTNAFDEAITTPSPESVRRALAIQMIINREWGLTKNENPLQGSFIVDELTDLVEEAVLAEFDRITRRGGVLGAMETGYQRGRIQEESMYYEYLKQDGQIPIIGVNTFMNPEPGTDEAEAGRLTLSRSTEVQKKSQLDRLAAFRKKHEAKSEDALNALKEVALSGSNLFEELMSTVRVCSLGAITQALHEVGGKYRRNM